MRNNKNELRIDRIKKLQLGIILGLILIVVITSLFLKHSYSNEKNNLGKIIDTNSPYLKIFGVSVILGTVNLIENQTASVKIIEIKNYTLLESRERLINVGDDIIIHFVGVGNNIKWKTNLLFINTSFSSKIRCLDGRINSNEVFTKDKCFWEANEEEIAI